VRRVLVTGGAGFIGSHLVRALLGRGDEVRVLDDLSSGSRQNLAGLDVELIISDLGQADHVRAATQGVDTIFHLGAMISVPASLDTPAGCYQTNVLGSLNVLEAARREAVRRVVLASSCAIYGDRETAAAEGDPPDPRSPYALSKQAMEDLARFYAGTFGLSTVSLRYFNVYGPRQDPRSPYAAAIPLFIRAMLEDQAPTIFGDGRQSRDFVFVEDVVQANLLAADMSAASGEVFNIGCGESTSILDLVLQLRRLFPGAPEPMFAAERPGDIRLSAADLGRATGTLGYRPAWPLHQGLQATVEWMRARPTQPTP
jgi:UDP-glucose 4-epimerase